MIKAVLFDMDGTVFDTERIYRKCWFGAAEAVGFHEMEDLLARIFGVSERDIGTYVYERYGVDFPYEKMLALRAGMIADIIEKEGVPFKDGVPEVFDRLKSRGIQSALVTSAPRFRVEDFLNRTNLWSAFSCVVTGEQVKQSKPEPDIFLLAAKELGLEPHECMVAEDSRFGVMAGHRAGMRVAMIPDLQDVNDEVMPFISDLLSSLDELPDRI